MQAELVHKALMAYTEGMKASKARANYRRGRGEHRCSNCTMFVEGLVKRDRVYLPNACTAVQGEIAAEAVCDYFKPKETR